MVASGIVATQVNGSPSASARCAQLDRFSWTAITIMPSSQTPFVSAASGLKNERCRG